MGSEETTGKFFPRVDQMPRVSMINERPMALMETFFFATLFLATKFSISDAGRV